MPFYGYRLGLEQMAYPQNMSPSNGYYKSPGFIDGTELVSNGNLSYLEFIKVVKYLWEKSFPSIPILPVSVDRSDTLDKYPAIIGYAMELKKAHTNEPKPRFREHVMNNSYTIYGQKFQNIISFTVMSKVGTFEGTDHTTTRDDLDAAVLCDEIMEVFEDFMQEYTPVLKASGAAELVYSRRLSDSEINRQSTDIHKRTVTYMVTTEKTFAISNTIINSIAVDIRAYIASDLSDLPATPDYSNVEINQVDLNQTATPNI